MRFEWDEAKAQRNLCAHGISFELGETAFEDPCALDFLDDRRDYGELRYVLIGTAADGTILYVAYTERDEAIRLISARRATRHEKADYFRANA